MDKYNTLQWFTEFQIQSWELHIKMIAGLRQRYDVKDSKTSPDKNPSLVAVAPGLNKKCCQCPKNQQQLDLEQRKRQFDIALENHIHNFVYVKHEPGYEPYFSFLGMDKQLFYIAIRYITLVNLFRAGYRTR